MDLEISLKGDNINWGELVGKEHNEFGYRVVCWQYLKDENKVKISEQHGDLNYTNEIVLADKNRAVSQLAILGFNISFSELFKFSENSIIKSQALVVAGFNKLIRQGNGYTVDDIFPQNFLTHEELDYLISSDFYEYDLKDII